MQYSTEAPDIVQIEMYILNGKVGLLKETPFACEVCSVCFHERVDVLSTRDDKIINQRADYSEIGCE